MNIEKRSRVGACLWSITDIPFDRIDSSKIHHDETLFFVLASASLVESGSDIYAGLLSDHFGRDSAAAAWLTNVWKHEELQHGRALRAYVAHAWSDFDWENTRKNFMAEYSTYCLPAMLEPSRALELVARCVVETGTAALYRALHEYTKEPVLKQLAANIWSDEVRHYKNFYRYFNEYNLTEENSRWKISLTLAKRLSEIRNEDADCALRHVFAARYPNETCNSAHFQTISSQAKKLVMHNMTSEMMIKMFLKPLDLPSGLRPYVQRPLTKVMQRFLAA